MTASDIQPRLLRQMTVRTVFETLQQRGPRSRAELTRETGISAPTVSKVVEDLIDQGLIEETAISENLLGRPGKRICIARTRSRVVGILVDSTSTEVFTMTLDGEVDPHRILQFANTDDFSEWRDKLVAHIVQLRHITDLHLLGIGICLPGLISRDRSVILHTPVAAMLEGRSISRELSIPTGLRTVIVRQSQALCSAERLYGQARSMQDFVVLDASDGDSVGVFCEGELLTGRNGLAGNLDSLRLWENAGAGNRNSETIVPPNVGTDRQFIATISQTSGQKLTFEEILGLAREGKVDVSAALRTAAARLARVATLASTLFNPTVMFIRTRLQELEPSFLTGVTELVAQSRSGSLIDACEIRPVSVSIHSAAAAAIVDHLTRSLGPRLSQTIELN